MIMIESFVHEQEMWLDKNSGQLCLSISSKALRITGIDDRRYWNHIATEESRCTFHLKVSILLSSVVR